ncbi:unnamed protein product, partial [Porites lobata]
ILLLTLVGNSLVCFSVYFFPRLRKPTNYLIVSLAVSDLLVGAFSLPFRIAQTVNGERFPESLGLAGCRFWIWVDMLCCGASIFNLVSISIERLMAVKWPLRHRTEMTSKRAFLMILLVWIFALLVASLVLVNWSGRETVVIAPQCSVASRAYVTIVAHRRPTKSTRLQSMRQLKATKTIAIVLGVFIFSWFPFFVIFLTFNYCTHCFSPTRIPIQLKSAIVVTFVYVLPVSNSAVNPIIYTCFNETFRSAF